MDTFILILNLCFAAMWLHFAIKEQKSVYLVFSLVHAAIATGMTMSLL